MNAQVSWDTTPVSAAYNAANECARTRSWLRGRTSKLTIRPRIGKVNSESARRGTAPKGGGPLR